MRAVGNALCSNRSIASDAPTDSTTHTLRSMTERVLITPMRILLGVLGVIALGAGVVIGIREVRLMRTGSPVVPAVLLVAFCLVVAVGGVALMRGALRGRIAVRRPGHRPPLI